MYQSANQNETSEFRVAEKRYQRHLEQIIRYRRGKAVCKGLAVRPTDFSGVIDVDNAEQLDSQPRDAAITATPLSAGTLFLFRRHPGFLLLRNALDKSMQTHLIVDCLTTFPDSPATTNLTRDHGALSGLWQAAHQSLYLYKPSPPENKQLFESEQRPRPCKWVPEEASDQKGPSAQKLLHKLRWASIGPIFDWSQREYVYDCDRRDLPSYLIDLATALTIESTKAWHRAEIHSADTPPAAVESIETDTSLLVPPTYFYDAALVNLYHDGDTLGGHLDDAELDMSHPIVSISLGAPGILLMGGDTKDVAPTPVWLRSGDVVIFAGPARKCYHGVPRIVSDWEGRKVDEVLEGLSPEMARFMETCRINVSVRGTR